MLLFHSRRVLVADSDLNNNQAFQRIFLTNAHQIQAAIHSGRLLLALRNNMPSLTDLNKSQAGKRARPEMLVLAEPFTTAFDQLLHTRGISAVGWDLAPHAAGFGIIVDDLIAHVASPLASADRELLAGEVEVARRGDGEGRLFFGNLYRPLLERVGTPRHSVVQAVRSAHMLNVALGLGLDPSLALDDVDVSFAGFIMRREADVTDLEADPETWLNCLPRTVLNRSALDMITFDRIPEYQKIAADSGYYDALQAAKSSFGTAKWASNYSAYLVRLTDYLKAFQIPLRMPLTELHEDALKDAQSQIKEKMYKAVLIALFPVVVALDYSVITTSITPYWRDAASFAGVASLVAGVWQHIKSSRLQRILDGNTTLRKK